MVTKIRLARFGRKKRPYYKIVVTDNKAPRDGKFIEKVGTYNPLLPRDDVNRIQINQERVALWISNGAQCTDRVEKLITLSKAHAS